MIRKLMFNRRNEKGAAIIFGFMFSLLALGLSFIIMMTTVTSVNVASVASVNKRLQLSSESAINTAVFLINSGYNFAQHNALNKFKGYDSVGAGSLKVNNISWEWWVEPVDIDSTNKCTMGIANNSHYCGYYVYAKSSLLNSDSDASVTLRGRILPIAVASAAVNQSRLVSYAPAGPAIFRHGLFGAQSVSISQGVSLAGYQSDVFGTIPTVSTSAMSISSGGQISLPSGLNESSIDVVNLYKSNSGSQGSCIIGGASCNNNSINTQEYHVSLNGMSQWAASKCSSYDVSSVSEIPAGVTCYNGDLSLSNNVVIGDVSNPSIIVVNGNLTVAPGANINMANSPSSLQIYVSGNVNVQSSANNPIQISALIYSSGTTNITGNESNGKVKIYGALIANSMSISTNVDIWQDGAAKYLKDPANFPVYQVSGISVIESVRDEIPFSVLGDIFGNNSNIDSSLSRVIPND
jgi:hypothetical protein